MPQSPWGLIGKRVNFLAYLVWTPIFFNQLFLFLTLYRLGSGNHCLPFCCDSITILYKIFLDYIVICNIFFGKSIPGSLVVRQSCRAWGLSPFLLILKAAFNQAH